MDEQAQTALVEDLLRKSGMFFRTRDEYLQADTEKLEAFATLTEQLLREIRKFADQRRG